VFQLDKKKILLIILLTLKIFFFLIVKNSKFNNNNNNNNNMQPIRKSKVISQEQVRWSSSELIDILKYLDNNVEMWNTNRYSASAKAIEATNYKRDAKSVYNKIRVLIKSMEQYHKTGEKSSTCTVIWDNQRIFDLVENIYNKTKEKNDKNQETESCIIEDERYDDFNLCLRYY
jgi:hypothetical protein